ncbi:MAG: hypothetical protein DCF19_18470 [Pseudanabaena frigida]|uniref:Exostosin GT47 domain-containing protein n=1 Tax=Pseudanabaena frigida TaxID=945775 RepID=A0A2W4Y2V7_9CYAN|nr:MAG: hypothetical protein DCF19_18470 [Pseudanabaena frigida]
MEYSDIITGDRVISLCDFVIITEQISHFHINVGDFINPQNVLFFKDFKNISSNSINKLNSYFENFATNNNKKQIKLFVYTHLLEEFVEYVVDILDKRYEYIIYLHNSDHHFNDCNSKLLEAKHITKVFSQNINLSDLHPKLNFLPIGIANSMWEHGNIHALHETITRTSSLEKIKNLYVNINPNTFPYRKDVLGAIKKSNSYLVASEAKPFAEYLNDLSEYRFCLCVRGNGVDTHRFWESLYLGVIPVIINNKHTNTQNYIQYLNLLDIPFFEITEDSLDVITQKYTNNFFNENLYCHLLEKLGKPIYSLDALKISHYSNPK